MSASDRLSDEQLAELTDWVACAGFASSHRRDALQAALEEVRASRAREAGGGWIAVSDALPDSDILVVTTDGEGGYVIVELEFSDDSDGQGMACWHSGEFGELAFEYYSYWMPLPPIPAPPAEVQPETRVP